MAVIYGVAFGMLFGFMIAVLAEISWIWPVAAGAVVGLGGGLLAKRFPAPK